MGFLPGRFAAVKTALPSSSPMHQAIGANLTGTLAGKSHTVSVGVHWSRGALAKMSGRLSSMLKKAT